MKIINNDSGDPYSEFVLCIYPSKVHTHSREHTHTVNTHPEQWAAIYAAAPGSSWGFGVLLKSTPSWYWKWTKRCTFTPPTDNPCRPETRTRNLWIMSPSLTLGHDFPHYYFKNIAFCAAVLFWIRFIFYIFIVVNVFGLFWVLGL